jgi:hypothetical protein
VIYELRRYQLNTPPMAAHFNAHMETMVPLFDDHGLSLVGAWDAVIGASLPFHTYMLRWPDLAHRESGWAEFYADPRFDAARDAMNARAGQTVVLSHDITILNPASYSPLELPRGAPLT